MSFESIELDFDDSEDKNSDENSNEESETISNDLISQGSKNRVRTLRMRISSMDLLEIPVKVALLALCGLLHQNILKMKYSLLFKHQLPTHLTLQRIGFDSNFRPYLGRTED